MARKIKGYIKYDKFMIINGQTYELAGLVVHWGTLGHGHYISVVSRGKNWYYCNDS